MPFHVLGYFKSQKSREGRKEDGQRKNKRKGREEKGAEKENQY